MDVAHGLAFSRVANIDWPVDFSRFGGSSVDPIGGFGGKGKEHFLDSKRHA